MTVEQEQLVEKAKKVCQLWESKDKNKDKIAFYSAMLDLKQAVAGAEAKQAS